MPSTHYIGVVDLTVRLTSMNPLGHIDARQANKSFERHVITACRVAYDNSADPQSLVKNSIVIEGLTAKYFHFVEQKDLLTFIRKLRSLLIEDRLPFKICVGLGSLESSRLRDRLETSLADAIDTDDEVAKDRLLNELGVDDEETVRALFELYRAPSVKDDAVLLSAQLETFKGFGICLDKGLAGKIDDGQIFFNQLPVRTRASGRVWQPVEYLDFRFPTDSHDVVMVLAREPDPDDPTHSSAGPGEDHQEADDDSDAKFAVDDEEIVDMPATGSSVLVAEVFNLLTRSFKASEENGTYYTSLLTTIVRSSHYADMIFLPRARKLEPGGRRLASGWQKVPPVYVTLLARRQRPMLKKIGGFELVLGALIDEIYSGLTGLTSSASVGSEGSDAARAGWAANVFKRAVKDIEAAYGEAMLRKILASPAHVLREERKREVLTILSAR